MPSSWLQRFRPGFLKASRGATGAIELDPVQALSYHEAQIQKFAAQQKIINSVMQFAKPLLDAKSLLPGYKIFAPDGYLAFYKVQVGMSKGIAEGALKGSGLDDSFVNGLLQTILPEDPKSVLAVHRPRLFQIPEGVAGQVQEAIKPLQIFPQSARTAVKLLYDGPLNAFRYTVLGLKPAWVVGVTAGNLMLDLISHVNPLAAGRRLMDAKWREAIEPAMAEVEAGGFRKSEERFMGQARLTGANPVERAASTISGLLTGDVTIADSRVGEAVRKIISFPVRMARGFAKNTFELNTKLEGLTRKLTYIDRATKEARASMIRKTASLATQAHDELDSFLGIGKFTEDKLRAKVAKLSANPETRARIVKQTTDVLNDYSSLSGFERQVVRRVFPFWAWWKFINTFAVKLALKDPAMANLARGLSAVGNDIEAKEWKANGLDPREIPIYRRGVYPLGKEGTTARGVRIAGTSHLQSLGLSGLNVAPAIDMAQEYATGRQSFNGEPFSQPNVIKGLDGKLIEYDPVTKKARLMESGPRPPLISTALRKFIPVSADIENAIYPYRHYDTDEMWNHHPVPGRGTKPLKQSPLIRLGTALGARVEEMDTHSLRHVLQEVKEAAPQIRRQLRRMERVEKKIKEGK